MQMEVDRQTKQTERQNTTARDQSYSARQTNYILRQKRTKKTSRQNGNTDKTGRQGDICER